MIASWKHMLSALLLVSPLSAAAEAPPVKHPIVELRQYKIVAGKRDQFIKLFDRELVDTQEVLGIRLVGQFQDIDDPNRFVWIREFPDMESREKALTAFYFGPVWKAHRDEANPMLFDNDNVLLLRPSSAKGDFTPPPARDPVGKPAHTMVFATIYYLWKDPTEGFSTFFDDKLRPALEAAGMPVLASLRSEEQLNNFPRLPVRQGEKVFVWFTSAPSDAVFQSRMAALKKSAAWKNGLGAAMKDSQERQLQLLRLRPSPRSTLR